MECVFQSSSDSGISAVYRLGSRYVNWYLIDSATGLIVIDTGLAGQWPQLGQAVAQVGKTVADITHILLTHSHPDHMGSAERIRQASGGTVWIHEMDAQAATTNQAGPLPTPFLIRLWRPAMFRMFMTMIREEAMKAQPVQEVRTFTDNATLAVPGSPSVMHVPGHTPGSCAFYFKAEQLLFSGDAIVTFDLFRVKQSPPTLAPGEDAETMRHSLKRFQSLKQVLLLPGHGKPWTGDITQAVHHTLS